MAPNNPKKKKNKKTAPPANADDTKGGWPDKAVNILIGLWHNAADWYFAAPVNGTATKKKALFHRDWAEDLTHTHLQATLLAKAGEQQDRIPFKDLQECSQPRKGNRLGFVRHSQPPQQNSSFRNASTIMPSN